MSENIINHAVLVLKDRDKILFVKRSIKKKTLPGAWAFPSGTIKEKETSFQTIVREAKEELDIEANPLKIITETELPEFSTKLSFILCNIKRGTPIINEPDEIEELAWMTFNEFFNKFSDNEIGHGLVWLRKNPEIWGNL